MPFFYCNQKLAAISAQTRHDENFNDKIKVAFESQVAFEVIIHPSPTLIGIVQRVSLCLLSLLTSRQKGTLFKIIQLAPCTELLSAYFGPDKKEVGKVPPKKWNGNMAESIVATLSERVTGHNMTNHLQIAYCIGTLVAFRFSSKLNFDFDLYSKFLVESFNSLYPNQYNAHESSVFIYDLFSTWEEKLKPKDCDLPDHIRLHQPSYVRNATQVQGIYPKFSFSSQFPTIDEHKRGADKYHIVFTRNAMAQSPFLREAEMHHIPLIAGLSGSVARWLCFIQLLGMNPKAFYSAFDFKCYSAAIVCYFIHCGHHSMHEMAYQIRACGGDYQTGSMTSFLPSEVILPTKLYEIYYAAKTRHPFPRRRSMSI